MRTQLRTLLPLALSIALGCKPDADQQGIVVDLGEPRANSTVDRALEFGCIEFLHLTFVHDELPPDLYEFRLAASGREARCEFMLPYEGRRIRQECFVREYPTWKPKCPDYCAEHCTKGKVDYPPFSCTGDLKVQLASRKLTEPHRQGGVVAFEDAPTFMLTEVPDSLEVTLLRDGQVVRRETIRPDYRLFAPNQGAQPVCRQAVVDVGGKAAAPVEGAVSK